MLFALQKQAISAPVAQNLPAQSWLGGQLFSSLWVKFSLPPAHAEAPANFQKAMEVSCWDYLYVVCTSSLLHQTSTAQHSTTAMFDVLCMVQALQSTLNSQIMAKAAAAAIPCCCTRLQASLSLSNPSVMASRLPVYATLNNVPSLPFVTTHCAPQLRRMIGDTFGSHIEPSHKPFPAG
jgi:hypothetical protein